ncbi:uncharacterized protein METZ01_LOCUS19054 [marine metagenome]|uniref:Uncharacterized protein n=1 Tax=marine metagenome TaxID=408172 RepID=A0A381PGY5_9ZZZZ
MVDYDVAVLVRRAENRSTSIDPHGYR